MKTNNKHPFYVPATNAQKFEFYVGTENTLTVIREEQWFYQLEQDGQKKPLGNVVSTCQYLYRCQAQWFIKENRKKRMFYHYRSDVMQMLREGFTVVHVESGNRISYTEDYSRIVCSSSIVLENDVPPGNFCIDFTEPKLAKTYNEMKVEKLFAKVVEEEKQKKLKKEIEKKQPESFLKEISARGVEKDDSSASIPQQPVENESSHNPYLKFVGAAAMFLGGLGLGLLIKN